MAIAAPPTPMSQAACKVRAQNQTANARLSREKRLMTHLGLKGKYKCDILYSLKGTYLINICSTDGIKKCNRLKYIFA